MNFQVSQTSATNINFLEHVVVTTSLTVGGFSTGFDNNAFYDELYYYEIDEVYQWMENSHPRRGDIRITLTSPQGTESVLLPYRNYDFVNEEGYDNWPFMSVHHWGEDPTGQWTLSINFRSSSGYVSMSDLALTLYGTAVTPQNFTTHCSTQCSRGCSGPTPQDCDACTNLRIASNLDCVSECPSGTHEHHSYCLDGGGVAIIAGSAAGAGALLLISSVSILCICLCICYRKRTHRRGGFSFVPLQDPTSPSSV